MKKKGFITALITVVSSVGCYIAMNGATKNNGLSDIQLANIEALTSNEVEVVSCIKESGSVCVIIVDGVVAKEYKNKTRDRRR